MKEAISDYYSIVENRHRLADVYLFPEGRTGKILVVRNVIPHDALEEGVRKNYDAWCKGGELI